MAEEKKIDYAGLAKRAVDEGNVPTVPSTLYFTYARTDGDSIVAPATSAESYLRKGYTITGEQTIESFAAWNEEQSAKAASKTAEHAEHEHAQRTRTA